MIAQTPVSIPVQKAFRNHKNEEAVLCPHCGTTKTITHLPHYTNPNGRIRINCGCGCVFDTEFDPRRAYRKKVSIPGICTDIESGKSWNIIIQDLSLSGVGFKTKQRTTIRGNQKIEITFILNPEKLEEICKTAVARRIKSNFIGAEFCDIEAHFQELDDYIRSD